MSKFNADIILNIAVGMSIFCAYASILFFKKKKNYLFTFQLHSSVHGMLTLLIKKRNINYEITVLSEYYNKTSLFNKVKDDV